MFDSVAKFQIEQYPADFAAWLLGEPIALTKLQPTELSIEPIRADSLILLQSDTLVLHCEFQTDPDLTMPFRMADYRLRVYRKFPDKAMKQVVIYLRTTGSAEVFKNSFQAGRLNHEFDVIRIWEEPAEMFLTSPGLWPYAVLGKTTDQAGILRQVSTLIEDLPRNQQSNLIAVTSVMAGLKLNGTVIQRLMRSDLMKESVIYQEILAEGLAEGLAQGEAIGTTKGLIAGERSIISKLLTKKLGILPINAQTIINELPLDRLEALGDALLDFDRLDDLLAWLDV
jgi:predicted transposase/invertase (TIGR01784 family)